MRIPALIITKFNRQSESNMKVFRQRAEAEIRNACTGLKGSELRGKIEEISKHHLSDLNKMADAYCVHNSLPNERLLIERLHLIDNAKKFYFDYFSQLELALFDELSAGSDFAKEQKQPPPIKV